MKTPIISIIVPIYNTEKQLPLCINSILNQTFKNYELHLIDDGSTDNCGKICDEFAHKDSRIKVVHRENGGKSSARNCGLKKAKGNWVGFVDSDDICEKDMFEILYKNALEYGADISVCGINPTSIEDLPSKSNKKVNLLKLNQKQAIKSAFFYDILATSSCNKLYKKQILLKNSIFFDENNEDTEDAIFVYNALKHSSLVLMTEQKLYNYIHHEASHTANGKIKDKMTGVRGFIKLIQEEKDKDNAKILKDYFIKYIVKIACYNVKHKNFNKRYHKYLLGLLKLNTYRIFFNFRLSIKNKLIIFFLFFPNIFLYILNVKKHMREFLK